jgi:hypothetical protein
MYAVLSSLVVSLCMYCTFNKHYCFVLVVCKPSEKCASPGTYGRPTPLAHNRAETGRLSGVRPSAVSAALRS